MKRLGTGLGIAAVFIVVTATAAFANHGIGSGSAACNSDGTITYTFTVLSSGQTPGDVTTRLGDGVTPFTVSETVAGTQTTDSLDWQAAFHEKSGKTIHSHGTITVTFTGDCATPSPTTTSPTPPPTTTPPSPSHGSHSPSPTTQVKGSGGSHVGGTAFSGSNATPAAGAALVLIAIGLGFMWVARERSR
jgi:hypothetical protein